jgi:hypothetical protein
MGFYFIAILYVYSNMSLPKPTWMRSNMDREGRFSYSSGLDFLPVTTLESPPSTTPP